MLASNGMRTAFRVLTQVSHTSGRSIHIPANLLGRKPPLPPGSGKNIVDHARIAFNRLLYGAKPATPVRGFARSMHMSQPIRAQLSFPARHALMGSPALPRPPALQRGITQVGLGTARKFGTARPIFQSLMENVPITARAAYELDLDAEKRRAKNLHHRKMKKENKIVKTEEKIVKKARKEMDFDKYFESTEGEIEVSTSLIVPLMPFDAPSAPLINIPHRESVVSTHEAHATHSLRISSLFLRLEQAKVWTRGAHYEAFGPINTGQQMGICTTLRIVFDGWTADDVRTAIGEGGRDWCSIREVRRSREAPRSVTSTRPPTPDLEMGVNHEFIMPTLDFSSSFAGRATPEAVFSDFAPSEAGTGWTTPFSTYSSPWSDASYPSRPPSVVDFTCASESDEAESEWQWSVRPSPTSTTARERWMGMEFSAEFSRRAEVVSNF